MTASTARPRMPSRAVTWRRPGWRGATGGEIVLVRRLVPSSPTLRPPRPRRSKATAMAPSDGPAKIARVQPVRARGRRQRVDRHLGVLGLEDERLADPAQLHVGVVVALVRGSARVGPTGDRDTHGERHRRHCEGQGRGPHRDQHPAQPRLHTWSPRRPEKPSLYVCRLSDSVRAMRLGLNLGYWSAGPADTVAIVQHAESLGYHSVWTAEAYGLRRRRAAHVGRRAHTTKIHLGTAILQMPARTPANTAMTAATLDLLSGGRFLLGLGLSRPAGRRGLARPAVRQAARQDPRVRRHRARDPPARAAARAPRRRTTTSPTRRPTPPAWASRSS